MNNKIFSKIYGIDNNIKNYDLLKYNKDSLCEITLPSEAEIITNIILNNSNNSMIIDCNGGMGGNTISFSKHFKVTCIEMNKDKYEILKNNLMILNINNVTLINDDSTNHLNYSDMIYFFDPPWGGINYKSYSNINLKLSSLSLYNIIKKIRETNNMNIYFKLPSNYNMDEFSEFKYKIYPIKNYQLVEFY